MSKVVLQKKLQAEIVFDTKHWKQQRDPLLGVRPQISAFEAFPHQAGTLTNKIPKYATTT